MYGFTDSAEVEQNASGGKFGLNTGAFITKFEYNPNAGAQGAVGDAIDLTVTVEGREFRSRFFPITKVFSKDSGEITDKTSTEYKETFAINNKILEVVLCDIVKCFVSEEALKEVLAAPINDFKTYASVLERLVKSVSNWDKKPVDLFLAYQWKPSGNNDKSYLEIPKYGKTYHGLFITASLGSGYVKASSGESLKYIKDELEHPFKRSSWFVESQFGKQTLLAKTNMSSDTPASDADWS